ncbi:MAG: bifunctional demethylmenaquinone methyltransferase/2-methoxy-6-polyprenyl-1,4-benzoquinol methylase UbiE [Bacteroidales bacterium]|nr:bifunctional demethylmenaquinone methyltransferase/2-methoxy-6-polyprenyl-1,4-benzoquinol methylase UbiE [Candidatus Colimorpha merdihippi]
MDKKHVGSLFDSIASTYDRFNHLLSLNIDKRWRRRAVRQLRPADHLLDVAVGTADLAIEVIRQNKASRVTGIDISTGMMDIGAQKISQAGMSQSITLLEASALEMPFADSTFSAVTCAYGVRNFSNLDQGLAEMFRVMKPGGQLIILEFSYPQNVIIRWCYNLFFTHLMPLVGKAVSRNSGAYLYFRQSVKNFIWGEAMAQRLAAAGFAQVSYRPMTLGITTLYMAQKGE